MSSLISFVIKNDWIFAVKKMKFQFLEFFDIICDRIIKALKFNNQEKLKINIFSQTIIL